MMLHTKYQGTRHCRFRQEDLVMFSRYKSKAEGKNQKLIHTHYYNSNLIWRTVSRRVDEVIPSDHPRREASRVIQWYGLIHET